MQTGRYQARVPPAVGVLRVSNGEVEILGARDTVALAVTDKVESECLN